MGIYFIRWVISLYHFMLLLKLFYLWLLGGFSSGFYILWHTVIIIFIPSFLFPFLTSLHFSLPSYLFFFPSTLSFFLPSWHDKLILYISCASTRINYFSKESWFYLLESGIRNEVLALGVLVAIIVFLLDLFIWQSMEISACILTRYVHSYICSRM